jgi:hypothetical protein
MGINSTSVSYGFGQLGSMYTSSTSVPMVPPVGKVFVAIQCLAKGALDVLETSPIPDPLGHTAGGFVSNETANPAHDDGDIKATAAHNFNGTDAKLSKINIPDGSAFNTAYPNGVQVGMRFVHSVIAPRSEGVWKVASVIGGTSAYQFTLDKPGTYEAASGAEDGYLFFDRSQGVGGSALDTDLQLEDGVTIFGRWDKVGLAGGAFIAYIGE